MAKIKYVREKTRIETELQFFFNLAQEIRTPIMLINNPINEIASIENLPENIAQKISIIQNSSKKLSNLADEILDLKKNKCRSKYLSYTHNRFNKPDC
ncbi:histidine kinase dimerization/phospho-acceptor domain-containing protein [Bacteroides thetaiotaomicron]|uniref:histidine kinase dimerization/phospho-acceptor domain-containing protein n=1 Tax=Bacteroides thetaiotaomicron TaxID=818 RepID=UPI0039C0B597